MAEWLRRWTANPLGSPRVGSNPILVDFFSDIFCNFFFVFDFHCGDGAGRRVDLLSWDIYFYYYSSCSVLTLTNFSLSWRVKCPQWQANPSAVISARKKKKEQYFCQCNHWITQHFIVEILFYCLVFVCLIVDPTHRFCSSVISE